MSTDHAAEALKNPDPYSGTITTIHGITKSVVDAANYLELPPLLMRFGLWAVCGDGLYCLSHFYQIGSSRYDETDWVKHVCSKTWVNCSDFTAALNAAKQL